MAEIEIFVDGAMVHQEAEKEFFVEGFQFNDDHVAAGGIAVPLVVHLRERTMGFQGFLKQSTAVDVLIGPFVDSTDGDTEEAALTINAADVMLSKNGQTSALKSDVTACAADADGFYNCELDATDTNTVGQLTLYVHVAGALAVRHDYHVVEEAVYDAMYGATAAGPLQSTTAGRTLDVAATGEAGLDFGNVTGTLSGGQLAAGVFGANAITASALATDAAEEIADAVWNEDATAHQTTGTFGQAIGDPAANTKTLYAALVTDAVGASVTADVATVQADTDNIQTRLPAALVGGAMDCDVSAIQAGAITAAAIATNAIDADAVAADAIDLIWDETMAGHVTADTAGLVMNEWQDGGRLDVILDARMAEASINTTGGAVDTVTTTTTATNLTNAPTSGDLTATMKASVNTEVVDALNVDTYGEPAQGEPAATATLAAKINYLYKNWRNKKTQTATTWSLYNAAADTVDHKSTVSDSGGTAEKTGVATGP